MREECGVIGIFYTIYFNIAKQWCQDNQSSTKADCARDTKIDPKTIRKWWDA